MDWLVFDEKAKDKYFVSLDPAIFDEVELKTWYMQLKKQRDAEILRAEANVIGKAELKKNQEYLQKQLRQYSDAGRAMMDGVKVLHKYLGLVDDNHFVLLHIG